MVFCLYPPVVDGGVVDATRRKGIDGTMSMY